MTAWNCNLFRDTIFWIFVTLISVHPHPCNQLPRAKPGKLGIACCVQAHLGCADWPFFLLCVLACPSQIIYLLASIVRGSASQLLPNLFQMTTPPAPKSSSLLYLLIFPTSKPYLLIHLSLIVIWKIPENSFVRRIFLNYPFPLPTQAPLRPSTEGVASGCLVPQKAKEGVFFYFLRKAWYHCLWSENGESFFCPPNPWLSKSVLEIFQGQPTKQGVTMQTKIDASYSGKRKTQFCW